MTDEAPIAVRRLKATWEDGTSHDVLIEIMKPYASGNSFRSRSRVTGLQQEWSPPDFPALDAVQALTMSLTFIRFLLEWHLREGGQLFYEDGVTPYTPTDLPATPEK